MEGVVSACHLAPCLLSTPTIDTTAATLCSSIAHNTPRWGCALLQGVPHNHREHQALPIPYAVGGVGPTCSTQADKPPALTTRLGGAFPFYSIIHKAHAKVHKCSLIQCRWPSWRSLASSSTSLRAPRTLQVTRVLRNDVRTLTIQLWLTLVSSN